jgi:hypothetical protein
MSLLTSPRPGAPRLIRHDSALLAGPRTTASLFGPFGLPTTLAKYSQRPRTLVVSLCRRLSAPDNEFSTDDDRTQAQYFRCDQSCELYQGRRGPLAKQCCMVGSIRVNTDCNGTPGLKS